MFFIDHKTKQTTWEDPRIKNIIGNGPAVPYSRDYKKKYEYFRNKLKKNFTSTTPGQRFDIKVKRSDILEDSFRKISPLNSKEILNARHRLWIEFQGEKGLDYGGVAREVRFFQTIFSNNFFKPFYLNFSGFICYQKKCLIHITACSSILPLIITPFKSIQIRVSVTKTICSTSNLLVALLVRILCTKPNPK